MAKLRYEHNGKSYLYINMVTFKAKDQVDTTHVLYRPENSDKLYTRPQEEFFTEFKRIHG